MVTINDATGRQLEFSRPPKRIISLVPSLTELLFHLKLDDEIFGVTNYCIHPSSKYSQKTKIGDPRDINMALIKAMEPDLILASKEENPREDIEFMMGEFKVFVSDIRTFEGAMCLIYEVGKIVDRKKDAKRLIKKLQVAYKPFPLLDKEIPIAYLIWNNPFMTINNNTFLHSMLEKVGFRNVFADEEERYPTVTHEQILKMKPRYIFLSTEPYPFTESIMQELQPIFEGAQLKIVDGEMFAWYGYRMLRAAGYFQELAVELSG